jgi:hypothetical protein
MDFLWTASPVPALGESTRLFSDDVLSAPPPAAAATTGICGCEFDPMLIESARPC